MEIVSKVRTNIALCFGFTLYHSTMSARVGEAILVKGVRYRVFAFDRKFRRVSIYSCSMGPGEIFLLDLR